MGQPKLTDRSRLKAYAIPVKPTAQAVSVAAPVHPIRKKPRLFALPLQWRLYRRRLRRAWYRLSLARRRTVLGLSIWLILFAAAAPLLTQIISHRQYHLSAATRSLIGPANPNLASKLTYDASKDSYIFNQAGLDAAPATSKDPNDPAAVLKQLQAQTGGSGKKDKSLYSVELPKDSSKGITYHDNNLGLSFSVVPDFSQGAGQQTDDRLVYPAPHGALAVYTAKSNGLKEDFVLPKPVAGNQLSFTYSLKLPKELQARLLDNGALGIYSADPSFFGNISYGSTADEQRVMQARLNGEKTNLVFALPAPVIKTSKGQGGSAAKADFFLNGTTLTVKAANLHSIPSSSYPLSIDPSVVITSSSDFSSGNNEDNIDFSTADQINRGGLTGGDSTGSLVSNAPAGSAGAFKTNIGIWNNYIYMVGGQYPIGTTLTTIYYAPITPSTGAIGAWSSQSVGSLNVPYRSVTVYDGYMYAIDNSNGSVYAPLNANGSVGTFTSTNAPPQIGGASWSTGGGEAVVAYNGYLYVEGVNGTGTGTINVFYAPVKGDGSLGTWQTTTNPSIYASNTAITAYNGYVYIVGGHTGAGTWSNNVYYTRINSDGSLATCSGSTWCTASNSFTNAREGMGVAVWKGYLYILGGCANQPQSGVDDCLNSTSGSGAITNVQYSDMQYAPLYANGDVGKWTTGSFIRLGNNFSMLFANDYLYAAQGDYVTSSNCPGITCTNTVNFIPSADSIKVTAAGELGSFGSPGTAYPTARYNAGSTMNNGYLYVFGGSDNGSNIYSDIQYTLLTSSGTFSNPGCGTVWCSTTAMPAARQFAQAVAYNGYMYLAGGQGAAGAMFAEMRYAPINANGSLGSWTSVTAYSGARVNYGMAQLNGYVYIVAGWNGSGNDSDCQYAQLQGAGIGSWLSCSSKPAGAGGSNMGLVAAEGNLYLMGGTTGTITANVYYATPSSTGGFSSWTATTSMAYANNYVNATYYNGMIYAVGGNNGSNTGVTTTQYAPINSDGTLGTWRISAQSLANAGVREGAEAYQGYLYAVGYQGSTTSQVASINNGGSGLAGTFTTGTSFTNGRHNLSTVAYNGYLYVLGGLNGSTYYNDVQFAPINTNGSLGTWQYTCNSASGASFVCGFATARAMQSAVAYNGYLYVLGGYHPTGDSACYSGGNSNTCNDVQFAPINANGTIGTWRYTYNSASSGSLTGGFTTPRDLQSIALYNGYLYVLGGYNVSVLSDVQYAPINANGTLGTWSATTSFTTARTGQNSFANNGYLYVLGGWNGTNYYSDVQYAPINGNGSIGTWTATTAMPVSPEEYAAAIYGGYLYILGGNNKGTVTAVVYYAPINANGSLGVWTQTNSISAARMGNAAAIYQGTLYAVGGVAGSTNYADSQYAGLSTIARASHFSQLFDLGSNSSNPLSIAYNGTVPGGLGSISYRSASSSGVFGSLSTATALNSSGTTVCNAGSSRYLWVEVTLDDSQSTAVFPDASGQNNAYLTDLTVNYAAYVHPPPAMRLHGGKYFFNGSLQALDTCGS